VLPSHPFIVRQPEDDRRIMNLACLEVLPLPHPVERRDPTRGPGRTSPVSTVARRRRSQRSPPWLQATLRVSLHSEGRP
jgi:hypothetical protein